MPHSEEILIADLDRDIVQVAKPILREVIAGKSVRDNITEDRQTIGAGGGANIEAWSSYLYALAHSVKGTINATVTSNKLTCAAGEKLFAAFSVGDFIGVANLVTNTIENKEITVKTSDEDITLDATLSTESGSGDEFIFIWPDANKVTVAQDYKAMMDVLNDLYDFLFTTNSFTAPSEIRANAFYRIS